MDLTNEEQKKKKNIHGENCNWTDWFFNVSPHKCFTMLESYWSEFNPASMACSSHTQHVPTEIVYISYLLWYLLSVCKSVCTHSGKDLCSNKYVYIYIATNLAQLWYDALRCPESVATDAECGARSESPEWRQGHPSNNHATIVIEYYSIYCVDRCILFSAAQRDKLRVQLSASSFQRMSVKRSHDKN